MGVVVKHGVRFEVVAVTPEMAEKWLEGNTHHRPLRDTVVARYAQDLKAGRWGLTHQGIAFSKEGKLLDGQHRLWAIVESRCPMTTVVVRDLDEESREYIDGQVTRTVVDVLKLADPEANISNYRAAVARRMYLGVRTQVVMSRHELIDFMGKHAKALSFAVDEVLQGKKVQRLTPASVGAVIARASLYESHDVLRRFGAVLLGALPHEGEEGVHLLRSWLLGGAPVERGSSTKINRDLLTYMKVQRAVMAILRGERLRGIYPVKEEVWAIPGETGLSTATPRKPKAKKA